ncbi:hypothetical protein EDC05_002790 [Coemansia umbellata]|uniref:ABC transporter domain-containing protein n=1 Tax=Coemansia umbellata TaxID=1424467 RepID=A0ABQ8PN08_9FUNG|nr:hypothetical protein EDC05_002790 [Coemansia umbellata]
MITNAKGSAIAAAYSLNRLLNLVSMFVQDDRVLLCGSSEWAWSLYSDCFRSGFLWSAVLFLASGFSAAATTVCLVLPPSTSAITSDNGFVSDGSAPLACLSVGNKVKPVRHPLGAVVMFDNRLRADNDNRSNVGDDNSTPLAHLSSHKTSALVDSPEYGASWFDRLTFSWPNDMFHKGTTRQLGYSDLYCLRKKDAPVPNWRRYLHYRKPNQSLLKTMALTFTAELLAQGLVRLKNVLVAELTTKTLRLRAKGFSKENADTKGIDISSNTDSNVCDSKIMNILTADFNRVTEVAAYLDDIFELPLTLGIGIWYMYKLLGVSALIGLEIHNIAYVAQEGWLRNGTIRDNILFGEPYNKDRYEEVLRACALKLDLRILKAGDMTEISERGVTLSDGQKQRIALARAVYSSRRILLIDDCLSAVDAHTGKHVLMECLLSKTSLMQGRTCVLATHHVAMCLPFAQFLVMLHNGKIVLKDTDSMSDVDVDKETSVSGVYNGKSSSVAKDRKSEARGIMDLINDTKSEDDYTLERLQRIAEQEGIGPNYNTSTLQGELVGEEEREKGYVKFEVWQIFDWMDAGLAGFVLSYSLSFSDSILSVVRDYSYNELNMNSVERVIQCMEAEQEAALESQLGYKLPTLWPTNGDIQIENLVAEYVPGVPVLNDISLSVKHGEKIGVIGRTGAGKSTLSLALLRFVEASGGRIVLDGVDISKTRLEDLRRSVTIIPQDPVLFNGAIRFNLDPFNEYSDEIVWDVLRCIHLVRENSGQSSSSTVGVNNGEHRNGNAYALPIERMSGIFSSLNAEIKESGQNLSHGQRQLVALARALVRKSQLIVMDEATASVDFDTNDKIHRTIRGYEFASSTLLCIAHRLRTIIDYDRVLVLDKGKVIEFDTPYRLLQNKDGIFRSMCKESGEYKHLAAAANRKGTSTSKTDNNTHSPM